MSLRQRAVDAVTWSLVRTGGRQLVGFLIFIVLARLLDLQAFGLVGWASVFIGFFQVFVNAGLAQAIVQREEIEPEHLDTAFWTNLAISVGLLALIVACAGPVASLLDEPELAPVLSWLILGLVASALSAVPIAILQRRLEFKALALRVLVGNLAGGVIGIAFALGGAGTLEPGRPTPVLRGDQHRRPLGKFGVAAEVARLAAPPSRSVRIRREYRPRRADAIRPRPGIPGRGSGGIRQLVPTPTRIRNAR